MAVKWRPDGYHSVIPFLVVPRVSDVLEFLSTAFDAEVAMEPVRREDGGIMYAEVRIGDSHVMMAETMEGQPEMPAMLYLYVEDVDRAYERAIGAGGTSMREPQTEFYGDRTAGVKDRSGNVWWLATHVKDVSREELERLAAEQ